MGYLVGRVRRNQATPREKEELESLWDAAQNDDTLLNTLSPEEKESMRIWMLAGIKSRISLLERRRSPVHRMGAYGNWPLKVAASIAFLVAVSFFWTQYLGVGGMQEFHTAYGEIKTISLPDGSVVVINGNSSLRYDASWDSERDREVWIEGEGFFDVTHTVDHLKFIVHTEPNMDVQVLGTKFNVKTRRGKTEVMLQEGKVRLDVESAERKESMTLQPGELATLDDAKLSKVSIQPVQYASWKEKKLFFNDTPLREIAKILEDTYGTPVVFQTEELGDRKLSGEISSNEAADILNAIQESLDIGITYEDGKAVFHE